MGAGALVGVGALEGVGALVGVGALEGVGAPRPESQCSPAMNGASSASLAPIAFATRRR